MSNVQEPPATPPAHRFITGTQVFALSIPATILAVIVVMMNANMPGSLDLLVTNPTGIKMTVAAGAWLALGLAAYFLGCVVLNRYLRGSDRSLFTVLLGIACFVVFFLPAVYVLYVGPAAVKIQEELKAT